MEILAVVIWAPLMNFLIQRAKTKWNLKGEFVLVVVSLVIWLLYVSFQTIVPDVLEAKVINFVSQAGYLSILIYEFVIKKILPTNK